MAFRRLGQIRKGKPQAGAKIPDNLAHRFRISFDSATPRVEERLREFYRDMRLDLYKLEEGEFIVTELPIIIPLEDAFDYSVQANLRLPVCRSDSDGEYWKFIRHPVTLAMLVSEGVVREEHTDPQGNFWKVGERRNVVRSEPVVVYNNKNGKATQIIPKTKAILSVMLPYLGEWGEFEIVTTSSNGARKLRDEFNTIVKIAQKAGVDIIQMPIILKREQKEITKQFGGKAKREKEWLWVLEVEKTWFAKHLVKMNAGWTTDKAVDMSSNVTSTEPEKNPERNHDKPDLPPSEDDVSNILRPYNPQNLKQKFVRKMTDYQGEAPSTGIIAKHLGDILPADADRYAFTRWISGNTSGSATKLTAPQRFAFRQWLVGDDKLTFKSVVNEHCKAEAEMALVAAQKAEGQQELL